MKKSFYILIFAIIALLAAVVLLREPADAPAAEPAPEAARQPLLSAGQMEEVQVYYLSQEGDLLIPLTLNIAATTEPARAAVELLLAGPHDDRVRDSVPGDAKLIDIYTIYNTVYVDLSAEFLDIPADSMHTAVTALCATVIPLAEGYQLQLLIEGQGQERMGPISTEQALAEPLLNPDAHLLPEGSDPESQPWLICFQVVEPGNLLVPRCLFYPADEDPLLLLARETLPTGLSLNDLALEEGLAQVDISYDPAVAYRCGQAGEQAWVEALVRSLCRQEGIDAVLLSLEGADSLPKGTDLSQPLRAEGPLNPSPNQP